MQPTLGIVSLFLSHDYDVRADFGPDEDVAFDDFVIYDGGQPWRGALYLVGDALADPVKWRNKLAIGLFDAPAQLPRGSHYLQVTERDAKERRKPLDVRMLHLANAIQSALRKINRWMLATERLCTEKPDLMQLLGLCERETGLVSVLVDRNLHYLAASKSFAAYNPWFNASDASMDTNMINELMSDESFQAAQQHEHSFFYHYRGQVESYSACFNVFISQTYEARLLVQAPSGAKTHGQLEVAEYLGERITSVFVRSATEGSENSKSPRFQQAIEGLLTGASQPITGLASDLATRGWRLDQRYRVYAFSFMEPENEYATRLYYRNRIGHLFDNCCVALHDGVFCCVRNLSAETSDDAAIQQQLVLFLRENLCWTGVSNDFDDLRALRMHFREAQVALEMGVRGDSMEWHFRFADYALNYICEQARSQIPARDLAHPAYEALAAYDATHGTQLLESVLVYMQCRFNVSHAAERLNIHRSSMIARLDRIAQLTHFNWDDWDDCVHLALSFLLME